MSSLLRNWKVVVLSLIGATTFWFFNALNKNYQARIKYPVEFLFDTDSVVVMRPLPSTLAIDVSSGGWNLFRKMFWFSATPIQIALDNPTEIGFYTRGSLMPIVASELSDLTVNYLVTDTVHIDIRKKMSKRLGLYLDSASIDLADNHRLTSRISISTDSLTITGPKSFVDTLGAVYFLDLQAKGISGDFDRDVKVSFPKRSKAYSDPEEVLVRFDVEKFERHSVEARIEMINFPTDSSVHLLRSKVQVFYTVRQSKMDEVEDAVFRPLLDYKDMDASDSTVQVILTDFPASALDVEIIPEYIKVTKNAR